MFFKERVDFQGGRIGLGEGFRYGFRPGARPGVEDSVAGGGRLGDAADVVPALEEAVGVDGYPQHRRERCSVASADHAGHQHQQVEGDLYRPAGQGVLGLHDDLPVDVLADLGDPASDETYPVVPLGGDVEVLELFAEHPEIHVEAVHGRVREPLLHLYCLLDGGDAAYLGTLRVAGLLVAGAHAMHEADGLHVGAVDAHVLPLVEPVFEVAVGDDPVVDAVAVFFFPGGVEERESGGEEYGPGDDRDSVGEHDVVAVAEPVHERDFGVEENVGVGGVLDEARNDFLCGCHVGEEAVPSGHMPAQTVLLFHYDGAVSQPQEPLGRLESCDSSAYYDYVLFHPVVVEVVSSISGRRGVPAS